MVVRSLGWMALVVVVVGGYCPQQGLPNCFVNGLLGGRGKLRYLYLDHVLDAHLEVLEVVCNVEPSIRCSGLSKFL